MPIHPEEIFGMTPREPSRNMEIAMMLRMLADAIERDEQEEEEPDGRATEEQEIRVRPRIEPLGGA